MLDGISWACSEGVCHCSRCTRVCVSSVQRAHALTGNTGVEEAGVSLVKGAGLERETAHVSRLAMTTVTINDGGVGAVLTSGSIGRSADGVWFKPCVRCEGLAFSSTHPYAFRWSCTDCGFNNVFPRWRLGSAESVPPLSSCTWTEHAVMVSVGEATVAVCFDTRVVLHLPIALAMVVRGMSRDWDLVSETAAAFATAVWCASRLSTVSGHRFGSRAMDVSSKPAVVVRREDNSWLIDDSGVVYDDAWTPRSTATDKDLVSIGFAMDNNLEQLQSTVALSELKPAPSMMDSVGTEWSRMDGVTNDGDICELEAGFVGVSGFVGVVTVASESAWTYSRERRCWQWRDGVRKGEGVAVAQEREKLRCLIEGTQRVQSVQQRQVAVDRLQQAVAGTQRVTIGAMVEVPVMLSHDRMAQGGVDNKCLQSKNTVSTAPSVPMLIWQARERTSAMMESGVTSVSAVWQRALALGDFVNPFATIRAGASPLWDGGVSSRMWESTGSTDEYSIHTPMFGSASIVDRGAFKLDPDYIAKVLAWHPHGPWIADGARYGFSLMSDGAVRRQEEANPPFTEGEAQQVTDWMAKQVARGKTVPVSDVKARSFIGLFTSPVVGAPKPGGAEGEIRTCHHLSAGGESSVNEGIDFDPLSPIGLLQVDSVVSCIRYLHRMAPGRKIKITKLDMEGFFRQIPVRHRDMVRLTQRWNGILNVHTAFTFGARSAPHVCSVITNALCDEMARLGHFCQCFVDDCVMVAYEDDIESVVLELRRLIDGFGLIENMDKYVAAADEVAVVGVRFNTDTMALGITAEKRASTLLLLRQSVSGSDVTVGDLRILGGKLNFLATVVPFGRSYASFVWRLAGDAQGSAHRRRKVTKNLRWAVQWWIEVLEGKRFTVANMLLGSPESPLYVISAVSSDACKAGFGGVSRTHRRWIEGRWWTAEVVDAAQINVRECFGALLMVAALAEAGFLNGVILVFEVDNECTMWGVNKGHSRSMYLIFWFMLLVCCRSGTAS